MGHGQRIIPGDLEQKVTVRELRAQLVHAESRQGSQPRRIRGTPARDEAGAETESDRQPCRREGELRLGIGERGKTLREPGRVVCQDPHQADKPFAVHIIMEVEAHEDTVRLRRGVDAGLVRAEERDLLHAVHRSGDRLRVVLLSVQGEIHSDSRHRADTGDSSSEEELSPGRPGATGAGALSGRRHHCPEPSCMSPSS